MARKGSDHAGANVGSGGRSHVPPSRRQTHGARGVITTKAALVVVAMVAGLGAVAAYSHAATGPATIRVTDRQTSYIRLGTGIGAREIVRGGLYSSKGHRIGSESMICTYLDSANRICTLVVTLPKGTIVASGQLGSRLLFELAITGGTDLYDNARGSITSTSLGLRPRRDLLIFRLAG